MNTPVTLVNQSVIHKKWGIGVVKEQTDTTIKVLFSTEEKNFPYPDAFEKHLKCEDAELQKELVLLCSEKSRVAEELKKQRLEEAEKIRKNHITTVVPTSQGKRKYPKENIAFKCNFCDGGIEENGIGYLWACSDELISYNINVAHHSWCCNADAPCRQYFDGTISGEALDKISEDDGFVCYESQMLRNWTAYAGYVLKGENKQKPMKLNRAQINSLAILTTREPYAEEKDRIIFGVFLVDDKFEGDDTEEGYVKATSKYQISLSLEEAKKVLFWNYYRNENAQDKIAWGQGLHRYLNDTQAAAVLRDIVKVKEKTKEYTLAKEFFEHFCRINRLAMNEIPIFTGAMRRILL